MIQRFFNVVEWSIGLLGSIAVLISLFFSMFSDNPSILENLSPLQKFVFEFQGLFLIFVPGVFFISFVAQFFAKFVPWNHVVGAVGILGLMFALTFISVYA